MKIPRHPWIFPQSPNMLALMDDIMNARVPEILVSGPRNCSKSWTISQCELTLAEMYPGIQILNLRHEMSAMGALLSQWDNDILKYGLDDKRNPFTFHSSTKEEPRTHIKFDNGSKILFAGMDKPNKALGAAIDFAFYNEVQLEENQEHWSAILGSMEGGRAGNWGDGKHVAIADMNPTHKKFWAYLRANPEDETETPAMKHYRVRHIDHPQFYVWSKKRWTHKGKDTTDGLDRAYIPGTFDHLRNVLGEFCSAEGAVYPQFIPKKHNVPIDRDEISEFATWRLSTDFGKISSTGFYAEHDNRHIRFKEIYRKGLSINDIILKIRGMQKAYRIPDIECVFADHEHNGRQIMKEAGFSVRNADKSVSVKDGIDIVRHALTNDLIKFNANSLDEPDPHLTINCLVDELLALAYKPEKRQTGSKADDLPDPECQDHAADDLRYYCVDMMKPQIDDFSMPYSKRVKQRW